jgi:hypothetical protein
VASPRAVSRNKRNTIKKRKNRLRCHGSSIAIEPSSRTNVEVGFSFKSAGEMLAAYLQCGERVVGSQC